MQDLNLIGQYFYWKIALHISIPETTHDHFEGKTKIFKGFLHPGWIQKGCTAFLAGFEAESEKVLAKK